jgi:hypothetical protein
MARSHGLVQCARVGQRFEEAQADLLALHGLQWLTTASTPAWHRLTW